MSRIGNLIGRAPWLTLDQAMIVARLATAGFFVAHAVGRIVLGTIPQFGLFMETLGFPAGVVVVWIITATELVAGLLMILGRHVRWAALALFSIAFGGIVLIHARLGWWVGEHGTGGSEYSVALIMLLLLVAAHDAERSRTRV
ncbi:DoxX family protein [Brevundimonas sp.]|uniref:DoxX family protein n=1 Tax=Brevundimonas sp. TaxID=1871086 RepID=UPI002FDB3CBB